MKIIGLVTGVVLTIFFMAEYTSGLKCYERLCEAPDVSKCVGVNFVVTCDSAPAPPGKNPFLCVISRRPGDSRIFRTCNQQSNVTGCNSKSQYGDTSCYCDTDWCNADHEELMVTKSKSHRLTASFCWPLGLVVTHLAVFNLI